MRALVAASLAAGALALGVTASQGCMLLVGDGDYKVASGDGGGGGDDAGATPDVAGNDAAPMTCAARPTDTTCEACIKSTCCAEATSCAAQTNCASLATCESSCATSTCDCAQRFPSGVPLYLARLSCAENNCTACTAGLGDPCSSDAICLSKNCACDPAQCAGWCTKTCTTSADCAGGSSGGVNLFGQKGFCILNAGNNNTCFPGCVANADCTAFPGTNCEPTTTVDNMSAHICTLPSGDGGI